MEDFRVGETLSQVGPRPLRCPGPDDQPLWIGEGEHGNIEKAVARRDPGWDCADKLGVNIGLARRHR